MVPNQSASTLIDLTSGREIPLKNFPHSCKYSTGAALKVWFARGAIAIAKEGKHQRTRKVISTGGAIEVA